MKRLINLTVTSIVVSVGAEFGAWLWKETLKYKVEDFKGYLKQRKESKEVEVL